MNTHKPVLFVLIAVFALSCASWAQVFGPSEPAVETKLTLSKSQVRPGDTFEATVTATVAEGYHIGSRSKDAPSPAEVVFRAKGLTFDDPVYPPEKLVELAFSPDKRVPVYEGTVVFKARGKVNASARSGPVEVIAELTSQACTADTCLPPDTVGASAKITVTGGSAPGAAPAAAAGSKAAPGGKFGPLAGKNILLQIVVLYGLGLLLAFTPCIYPMVPVTIGYFTGQATSGSGRRPVIGLAIAYVLGLAVTYAVLGAVAARTGGVFGAAMQKPPVMIALAAVLVALALSMFGLYELRAPRFIESRSSGRSGILGALGMGAIFGIVAAPCAGPVVIGLMVHVAAIGSALLGFALFFALALGLGTPLFALAMFSAKLPVPGMWMVAVKKLAGFLLIGAAAYFLLPLVPRPYSAYLLPAVILSAAIYFAFFERTLRSSKLAASLGRAACAVAAAVAVAMVWPSSGQSSVAGLRFEPYTLERLSEAARDGKPVIIDFTADWCGVCREMEHGPFREPEVVKAAERFVRLQVDGTDAGAVSGVLRDFKVQGFPTLIFFDSTGKQVSSIVGYADADKLTARMQSVD